MKIDFKSLSKGLTSALFVMMLLASCSTVEQIEHSSRPERVSSVDKPGETRPQSSPPTVLEELEEKPINPTSSETKPEGVSDEPIDSDLGKTSLAATTEPPTPSPEEQRRIERELLQKRFEGAERARIAFLEQEQLFEERLHLHLEMERRRKREEALDLEEPQRRLFFYRETEAALGKEGAIVVPKGKRLLLFKNTPLRYHGISVFRLPCPTEDRNPRIVGKNDDLHALLLSQKGDWIIGIENQIDNTTERDPDTCEIVPMRANRIQFFPINVHSDGANYYRIDAESSEKNYFFWIPEKIIAVYE